ncbi:MAG: hypothetical protein K2W78_02480 [Xanthobacteraceae bacterium]|nr:hypothetical protein [Xanthobacteraceae bacterium]
MTGLWRTKISEYTWLRTSPELTLQKRETLVEGYHQMKAWPEVAPALQKLKAANAFGLQREEILLVGTP